MDWLGFGRWSRFSRYCCVSDDCDVEDQGTDTGAAGAGTAAAAGGSDLTCSSLRAPCIRAARRPVGSEGAGAGAWMLAGRETEVCWTSGSRGDRFWGTLEGCDMLLEALLWVLWAL